MLTLSDIQVTFLKGTASQRQALKGVSLHLKEGEFVTIVGSNGAGKSTLLGTVAGSVFAEQGSVLLEGQNITALPPHKRAGRVARLFQDPMKGTAPNLTVEENLALAALRGKPRGLSFAINRQMQNDARQQLADLGLGLEDRMKMKVGLLSGGQRQALTLLMATLITPKVLLLDEHTAALDPATAARVEELTAKMVRQKNITTLMITHDIPAALRLGSRTLLMSGGQVVLDLAGAQRETMTPQLLLDCFRQKSGHTLQDDRAFFSAVGGQ